MKHNRPDADAEPEVYVSHAQVPSRLMTFVIRSRGDASVLKSQVRGILLEALPGVPLGTIETIKNFRGEVFRPERFST